MDIEDHIEIFNIIYSMKDKEKLSDNDFLILNNKAYTLIKIIEKQKQILYELTNGNFNLELYLNEIESIDNNSFDYNLINEDFDIDVDLDYCNCEYGSCCSLDNKCINFKRLCDVTPNIKYILNIIKIENNDYFQIINTNQDNIHFNKTINENSSLTHKEIEELIDIYISLTKNWVLLSNIKDYKDMIQHVHIFIIFNLYDMLLKNYNYIEHVKKTQYTKYLIYAKKFYELCSHSLFIDIGEYYDIWINKWKTYFSIYE